MTPFTIASVSRSMFEYADWVGVGVDVNATGLLSCRMHAPKPFYMRRQLPEPFLSVYGSTTDMIPGRYFSSSDRHRYVDDLRSTRLECPPWGVLATSTHCLRNAVSNR